MILSMTNDAAAMLMVQPCHEPGSMTYIDESVAEYLYGTERFSEWVDCNGVLTRQRRVDRQHLPVPRQVRPQRLDEREALTTRAVAGGHQEQVRRPRGARPRTPLRALKIWVCSIIRCARVVFRGGKAMARS